MHWSTSMAYPEKAKPQRQQTDPWLPGAEGRLGDQLKLGLRDFIER